ADDLANARPLFDQDRQRFLRLLTASANSRNLPGAIIIDSETRILASAETGIHQASTPPAPDFLKNVTEDAPPIAVFIDH
ncbi:hypothetical protein NL529_33580, partial [Klebsiella pneumoniae]|nr:hypothetical protein [Klebsiella pneumoniae]